MSEIFTYLHLYKAKSLTGTRFVFMISIIFYYCQCSQNLLDFLKCKIKPPSFVHLSLPCYFDKTTSFGLNYKQHVTFLLKIHQGSLSISSLHGVKGPFKCQFKFTCLSLSFKQSLFQPCQQTCCFPNELYNFNFLALANAATPACQASFHSTLSQTLQSNLANFYFSVNGLSIHHTDCLLLLEISKRS